MPCQRSVFLWTAQAWREWHAGRQRITYFLGHAGHHRRFKNTGGNGHHTNAKTCQLTGRWQRQAGDGTLGGSIGGLADLAVVGGNRGGVDNDPTLTFGARFTFGHGCSGQTQQIEAADQINVDDPAETLQAVGAVLAQDFLGTDNAGAVDQPLQAAKRGNSSIDGGLGRCLLTDVGNGETCLAAQRLCFGLYGFGIEVDQHDLGTRFDEHFGGGCTEARGRAADDEVLVGNLHDRVPQALAVEASAACCLAIS
ncbi:hypothetical protein D3C77_320270 [compost metagenome]